MTSQYQEISRKFQIVRKQPVYEFLKRCMDFVLSLFALIVLAPVLLIVALLIYLEDKGPAIYTQTRIGKNGKEFKIYKFRSMCVDADKMVDALAKMNKRDGPAFKIDNDPRVTKMGHFIRKTCIDELPQLLNILKGEMSIVGPRPPLPREVAQYTDYQKQRLLVTPGLTCIWQVKKGEDTTFEEWVEMDIEYIKTRSLWVDIKLILLTFKVVLLGRGAE